MSIPIFTKAELSTDCVFDLDDCYAMHDRNAISELLYLKAKYPKMKVTLFVVPNHPDSPYKENERFLRQLCWFSDWIEIACHGWTHERSDEAKDWDEAKTNEVLDAWELWRGLATWQRGFKAPGWQISDATYKVLKERGYWVADHTYNEGRRPKEIPVYTLNHPWCFHGHTWDLPNADPIYRNGIKQLFQEHTLPWNEKTKFHFVSEVVKAND